MKKSPHTNMVSPEIFWGTPEVEWLVALVLTLDPTVKSGLTEHAPPLQVCEKAGVENTITCNTHTHTVFYAFVILAFENKIVVS
jgi:hypothetical protein